MIITGESASASRKNRQMKQTGEFKVSYCNSIFVKDSWIKTGLKTVSSVLGTQHHKAHTAWTWGGISRIHYYT